MTFDEALERGLPTQFAGGTSSRKSPHPKRSVRFAGAGKSQDSPCRSLSVRCRGLSSFAQNHVRRLRFEGRRADGATDWSSALSEFEACSVEPPHVPSHGRLAKH